MTFPHKHLLGIEPLSRADIETLLDSAISMKEVMRRDIKKVPALRGKLVVNLFFEASTRTRSSFEIAEKILSADSLNWAVSGSAVSKGETLLDTVKNLEAMRPDMIIIRHMASGAPHFIARNVGCAVVNAGDGAHEHPSQALLDAFTLRERWGSLDGKVVTIAGDIRHSRVFGSNVYCLQKLGAKVRVCGPPTMIPFGVEKLGCEVQGDFRRAVEDADAVMLLRIQTERLKESLFPNGREYAKYWGLDEEKLSWMKPDALVLHPGPVNRGVEVAPEVADGVRSVILDQVENGVAVRMAILLQLLGGSTQG